jgi:hypothetical protein
MEPEWTYIHRGRKVSKKLPKPKQNKKHVKVPSPIVFERFGRDV